MRPIPLLDAQWLQHCISCDSFALHASKFGFFNGSTKHCYSCGAKTKIYGFSLSAIKDMILSSFSHWLNFPRFPYNWHKLDANSQWKILKGEAINYILM